MEKTILIGLLVLLAGTAAAVPDSNELQEFKEVYNNQSDEVPGFVGKIVGGERVNFHIETNSSNDTVGVSFEDVEISSITENGFEDPTLEVWTDQETISGVVESENKFTTLRQKLEENDIRYEATTMGSKVKVTVFDTLLNLVGLIGLEI